MKYTLPLLLLGYVALITSSAIRADIEYPLEIDGLESEFDNNAENGNFTILGGNPLIVEVVTTGGGAHHALYGQDKGAMIYKIGVYTEKKWMQGIKFWLTDGDNGQYGNLYGTYNEYTFQPAETITMLSMWKNDKSLESKKRLCGVYFETSLGGKFAAQCDKINTQEYPIDVGSGICVGLEVHSYNEIDGLGFVFIKRLISSEMVDVTYPTLGEADAQVHMESLKSVTYDNALGVAQTFQLSTTVTKTTKEFWSYTAGLELAASVSVKAGIPGIVEFSSTFGFKLTASGTYGMENTKTVTETETYPVVVPGRTTLTVTISLGRSNIDLPYSGRMVMTTVDGSELSFNVNGAYTGVAYTKIRVDIGNQKALTQ